MTQKIKSKEVLNSSAHYKLIEAHIPSNILYKETEDYKVDVLFEPAKYEDLSYRASHVEEKVIPAFPIIYQGDGKPWDLGNLYLHHDFLMKSKESNPSIETYQSKAKALTMYLRWIEHKQKEYPHINVLYFPEGKPEQAVSKAYKRHLGSELKKTDSISLSTANARLREIKNFYQYLLEYEIVDSYEQGDAYKTKVYTLWTTNKVGLSRAITVKGSDLTLGSPEKNIEASDFGEKLTPITNLKGRIDIEDWEIDEQDFVLETIMEMGDYTYELFYQWGIQTGARKETISTLNISELKRIYKEQRPANNEYVLRIGYGHLTDLKYQGKSGKNMSLHIPKSLLEATLRYVESERALERRELSYYGQTNPKSDFNYVFLNRDGNPFMTAEFEIDDRQEDAYSARINKKNRVTFKKRSGSSIDAFMRRLNSALKEKEPSFRKVKFHDTRATFAYNYMADFINDGGDPSKAIDQCAVRLGHSNTDTTRAYLNYQRDKALIARLLKNKRKSLYKTETL
ncbi:site-specific integrase [Marinobacterium sp. xm-v-233]|uniref:site-specific integrase n=1 Tax=Marinobacterium sp. xm-v-233 TaxID=2497744 RepID=UPI0015684A08|nr:site-specific integrase [Marinobacterium sp. xm-v-233]NRQ00799.1 Phage integrase family protein [Marinobacterium sp. xm-v-233]